MVEVMRGCGRGCKFCDVTLRALRYYPPEKVQRESKLTSRKVETGLPGYTVMIFLFMGWTQEQVKEWNQTEKL